MGRKKTPGVYLRKGIWHIDKTVYGRRICESTSSIYLEEAERYLALRIEEIRQAVVYGVRPKRIFREAATKFLLENQHKASISDDACRLKFLDPFIGDLPLDNVHIGTLQPFIVARRKEVKTRTINHALQVVRRILKLAAGMWIDECGLTWLASAPTIILLPEHDLRKPYPLNWDEQDRLFSKLPPHLVEMSLYKVNTGCREQEVCNLRWAWEIKILELKNSIFIIPGAYTKNGEDRVVILNKIAQAVIERQRGKHAEFVFTYKGEPMKRMLNTGWQNARIAANLPFVRVHDLKHTFGRRLRAAGVSFEDRQDLLGHRTGKITTHYSVAEIANLLAVANSVCDRNTGPSLTLLRPVITQPCPAKVPQGFLLASAN